MLTQGLWGHGSLRLLCTISSMSAVPLSFAGIPSNYLQPSNLHLRTSRLRFFPIPLFLLSNVYPPDNGTVIRSKTTWNYGPLYRITRILRVWENDWIFFFLEHSKTHLRWLHVFHTRRRKWVFEKNLLIATPVVRCGCSHVGSWNCGSGPSAFI